MSVGGTWQNTTREFDGSAPVEFLRDEILDARLFENLRQAGAKAERVGQPRLFDDNVEFAPEEFPAQHDLAHERFAAGQIAVRLDPHRSGGFPLSRRNLLANLLVKRRIIHSRHLIELRLALRKKILGILGHQLDGGRKSARALAHRLAPGP